MPDPLCPRRPTAEPRVAASPKQTQPAAEAAWECVGGWQVRLRLLQYIGPSMNGLSVIHESDVQAASLMHSTNHTSLLSAVAMLTTARTGRTIKSKYAGSSTIMQMVIAA